MFDKIDIKKLTLNTFLVTVKETKMQVKNFFILLKIPDSGKTFQNVFKHGQ